MKPSNRTNFYDRTPAGPGVFECELNCDIVAEQDWDLSILKGTPCKATFQLYQRTGEARVMFGDGSKICFTVLRKEVFVL
jgi:hypothetical protein